VCCIVPRVSLCCSFNDPPPIDIYTLSLHDALPICNLRRGVLRHHHGDLEHEGPDPHCVAKGLDIEEAVFRPEGHKVQRRQVAGRDRKSTRLNSSHVKISYAVFCLKKKNVKMQTTIQ